MQLTDQLDYKPGAIAHKQLANTNGGMILMMAFDEGAKLDEHITPATAMVQILEGQCIFTLEGKELTLNAGDYLIMEPGAVHALRAPQKFKMLLTKLN